MKNLFIYRNFFESDLKHSSLKPLTMKISVYIILLICLTTSLSAQVEQRFKVKGNAKLIATWSGKSPSNATGTLTSGDVISITTKQISFYVDVVRNNIKKQLVSSGGDDVIESTVVQVYEYDFDSDGQKEIVVIHSPEYSILTVEVFRYSSGLAERVGNFNGQFNIVLDKNTISLPYGSQGLSEDYVFIGGSFFSLVYHDPNQNKN